jgi:hypothetical protein
MRSRVWGSSLTRGGGVDSQEWVQLGLSHDRTKVIATLKKVFDSERV